MCNSAGRRGAGRNQKSAVTGDVHSRVFMEAAWREHVGQLTLAQLSSSEACQKHLNEFELQLVSTALGQTVIGSVNDIQEKVASVLRCHPHPDAKSMTRLSSIHQSAYNAAIVDEILKRCEKSGASRVSCRRNK